MTLACLPGVAMRQLVRPVMLLVALCACAPDSRTDAERRAEAARADSSAAGYEVGPAHASRSAVSLGADSASRQSHIATANGGSTLSAGRAPVTPAESSSVQRPDSATGSTVPVNSGSGTTGRGTPHSGGTPTSGRSGRDSGTASLPPLDSATEASFLAYDTTKKTLTFQLSAGDEIPSQVSFNAARRGSRSLIVPIGWRVTILFANRDPQLPHSATIVDVVGPIPE